MRKSTFKPKSYKEKLAAAKKAQERARKRAKVKPKKATKKRTTRQKTAKKRKSKSLAKLKKELDSIFSKYIRQKYTNKDGMVACYTCGKVKHWKEQQNGHFISRQYLATRWDENNCRVQCAGCNIFGNGQLLDFEENLKAELGADFVEEMKLKRHQILKLDRQWYEEQIARYKSLIE